MHRFFMRNEFLTITLIVLSPFILAGMISTFAGCQNPMIPLDPSQMSGERKVNMAWGIYKAEFHNYNAQASRPDLTEEEKEVLKKKKEALTVMYHSIMAYRTIIMQGETPSPEQEQQILNFIDNIVY